ncbi:MCE family protein [Mycolicibacterium sp. 050232]|uniref:MCE family protein n=1 Tax=Mycolicibacterium sp. 050232 TaxID=3113982 RepID=UPI002E2DA9E3|nr:MCE family protein [Mycolicibacterium sp. 050232]MED5812630.1 MCE family protein [Mycolicibacterium sp. 050232]
MKRILKRRSSSADQTTHRRPRALEDRNMAVIGTIALLALTVVIVASTALSSMHLGKRTYTAEFLQGASLRSGDQVSVAGVPVGVVSGTKLAVNRVLVTMKLNNNVRLGAETKAAIKLTTVLGSRYVELRPRGGGTLPDGRIPLANTSVPYDLQKLLSDSTTTFEDVDAAQFASSMQLLSQQLTGVPAVLPDALTNVKNLSAIIAERRDQISDLLRNTANVAKILGGQQDDLAALVIQGRELTGEIVRRRASVERLLQAATTLITTAQGVMGTDSENIDKMLADLQQVTSMLGDHDELLRNLFQIMPVAMRNAANATGSGPFLDFMLPGGLMVDSWMCAISGRAEQWKWPERYQYFKDCE